MGYPLGKPRIYKQSVKVDNLTGCSLWNGQVDAYGFPVRFEKGKTIRCRQEQFLLHFGRIAKALADNSCGNRLCIEASHLVEAGKNKRQMEREAVSRSERLRLEQEIDKVQLQLSTLRDLNEYQQVALLEQKLSQLEAELHIVGSPTEHTVLANKEETNESETKQ